MTLDLFLESHYNHVGDIVCRAQHPVSRHTVSDSYHARGVNVNHSLYITGELTPYEEVEIEFALVCAVTSKQSIKCIVINYHETYGLELQAHR